MRIFGQVLFALCVLSAAISLTAIFGGNQYETANGIVFLGGAIGGVVTSCVLVTLVDIRDSVRVIANRSDERSSYDK